MIVGITCFPVPDIKSFISFRCIVASMQKSVYHIIKKERDMNRKRNENILYIKYRACEKFEIHTTTTITVQRDSSILYHVLP